MRKIKGQIVDIQNKRIYKGEVTVSGGKIVSIEENSHSETNYILPGFVDAHIHIESSMLVPTEFAKLALPHGTVASVSDPHEIANVLGIEGVEFMIENGKKSPFKFNFGAPSCVPATNFESAGAVIDSDDIKNLLSNPDIKYLAEMMNYPGVLMQDEEVLKKLKWAKEFGKPIDGHAPGLIGKSVSNYIAAGISTDHESFTYEEAQEKLEKGMKILVREGSAAKNFDALIDLAHDQFESMMFCSDDKHPDDLIIGHINELCARALSRGLDIFKILQMACVNPVNHYGLEVGLMQIGDSADFIVVEDLKSFNVVQTFVDGKLVAENGKSLVPSVKFDLLNNFKVSPKTTEDFRVECNSDKIRVIEALDGQLVTNDLICSSLSEDGLSICDFERDILKIAVVNRYEDSDPAVGFIKGFGLKSGAIASSVAHDSHNIIAVGVDDESICEAVNLIIENKGGICAVTKDEQKIVPLPVAGIMSDKDGETVAKLYSELDHLAKEMGSQLKAPFMTLSFMALLVIPSLKLSDKGLFDGKKFEFCSINI